MVVVLEVIGGGQQSKVAADDWPLIQPSEVQVAVPPVLTAEPRLTPLGNFKTLHKSTYHLECDLLKIRLCLCVIRTIAT